MKIQWPVAAIAVLAAAFWVSSAVAVPTISYGDGGVVTLRPNAAGQQVEFYISDGVTPIDGLELNIQVGDGGSDLGGTDTGPTITGIDLVTGTIFTNAGPAQADAITFDLARQSSVDTASVVAADGLLATVTFSTVGMFSGSFDLLLNGVAGAFDTTVFSGTTALTTIAPNGSIQIVPNLAGDYDESGAVGQSDLDLVLQFWGDSVVDGQAPDPLWKNVDDITAPIIGQDELALVLKNWGNTSAILAELSSISEVTGLDENDVAGLIPEPTSLSLLAAIALVLGHRRRSYA